MTFFRHPARASMALAVSQALYATDTYGMADLPIRAEEGAVVEARNRYIATAGNNQNGIVAHSAGQVVAQDNVIATSGNGSQGVHVRDVASRFDSSSSLHIFTSGHGASGLLVEQRGAVSVASMNLATAGELSHGVQGLEGAAVALGNAGIKTHGLGSHALITSGGAAQLEGAHLRLETMADLSSGVQVNRDSLVRLNDVEIVTEGARSRGLYAIGQGAALQMHGGTISTLGDNSAGAYALATDQTLALGDFQIATAGAGSHGVQVDQAHARLEQGTIHVQNGYSLWVGGLDNAGQPSSITASHMALSGGGVRALVSGQVSLADSRVFTEGDDRAAFGIGGNGRVSLDGVHVRTLGHAAPVALLDGGQLDVRYSDLLASNGQAINARSGRNQVSLSESIIWGDVHVADGATLSLALRDNAWLLGQLTEVTRLDLHSGSTWDLRANSSVQQLELQDGFVTFGDPQQFYTLTAGQLSGRGLFELSLNMQGRMVDFLDITGVASGEHLLRIQNTGVEPQAAFDPLQVIRTGGGDADFALVGNRVDLGAFSYTLQRSGDDWFLSGERDSASPSTRTVQALFNTAPSVWYGELSTLRSRLGEVRGGSQGGAWLRSYGNRYQVDSGGGLGYRQQQQGFTLGTDTALAKPDGQWLVGVLGGYSRSDLNLSRGSTGQVDSYYLGAYGSWLADDGGYVDAVLKLNQYQNSADARMSDATRARGHYRSHGLGASLELGKHVELDSDLFFEPFTQLSALRVGGRGFTLDNGLRARNAQTGSLLGKAGATVGRTHQFAAGGFVQPYFKAAISHEFVHGNSVTVNGHRFRNDLSGSRAEVGAGIAVARSSSLQLHGHVDYMGGERIEQPWGVNVGLRYSFD